MPRIERQREVCRRKAARVNELRRKYEYQSLIAEEERANLRDLRNCKETSERQLGLLEVRYEDAKADCMRLENSERHRNKPYHLAAKRDVEEKRRKAQEVRDRLRTVNRDIEKATRDRKRAFDKRDEYERKWREAQAHHREEQVKLTNMERDEAARRRAVR